MKKIATLFFIATVLFSGCENSYRDHEPPAGMGSIIVDNRTYSRIDIFIQGHKTNSVSSFDYRTIDLEPGEYRVVLDERNGDKFHSSDIDVLEDRLTVMEVFEGTSLYTYNVRVLIRSP